MFCTRDVSAGTFRRGRFGGDVLDGDVSAGTFRPGPKNSCYIIYNFFTNILIDKKKIPTYHFSKTEFFNPVKKYINKSYKLLSKPFCKIIKHAPQDIYFLIQFFNLLLERLFFNE